MKTYIHYGNKNFDREMLINSMTNERMFARFDKPYGLWASPVDAEWGWKDFCEGEDFMTESLNESFEFAISETARVLHIHSLDDAIEWMKVRHDYGWFVDYKLNLEKIYKHFDAMELHLSDDRNGLRDTNVFYGWDVDSIVVWNPDIIVSERKAA